MRRPGSFRRSRLLKRATKPLPNADAIARRISELEQDHAGLSSDFDRAVAKAKRIRGARKKLPPKNPKAHDLLLVEKASTLEACNAAIAGFRKELERNELLLRIARHEGKSGEMRKITHNSGVARKAIEAFEKKAEQIGTELLEEGYDFG